MHIHIIWIGKTKNTHIHNLIEEQKKRLSRFSVLEISELKDCKISEKEKKKKAEAESIMKKIKNDYHYYVLDERGKQYTSLDFAHVVLQKAESFGKLGFIIGGVYGLLEELKKGKSLCALSQMTFTHEMARYILLEQLYRAFTIQNGVEYHY